MSPTLIERSARITKVFQETAPMNPDEIDFSWWQDDELLNFAFDYDKVQKLNEDDRDALIYALARRLHDLIDATDV